MGKKRKRRIPKDMQVMIVVGGVLALFAILNIVAYHHAHTMLHFSDSGERTETSTTISGWSKVKVLLTGVNIPRPENTDQPSDHGMASTAHTVPVTSNLNLEAWYVETPDSRATVLLFHGYSSAKSSMLGIAAALVDLGYSVFIVDFRGSGGSDESETSLGFHEATDVSAAITYVSEKISPDGRLVLYGQSMGGAAILRALSAEIPTPSCVIVESVFDSMLSSVQNRFRAMGLPPFPCANLMVYWGGRQQGFSGLAHEPVDYAEDVTCPVLVLHGADDDKVTEQQVTSVFDALGGKKELKVFEGAAHVSCFSASPGQWRATVSAFLDSHLSTGQ